ncbi:TIGR03668 family PPOX class F420-dependent oxidoreductase [Jatrophihabitans sp. DSM 45814]
MRPTDAKQRFSEARVARLATVDASGVPHLVPIVFVVIGEVIYSAVDAKPKRSPELRRLANVSINPAVCLLADHYDDANWSRLWWARADGVGTVLPPDSAEATRAIDSLAERYPQHREQRPPGPVLAVEVSRWSGWAANEL